MRINGKPIAFLARKWLDNVRPLDENATPLHDGRSDLIVSEFLASLGHPNTLDDTEQRWVWATICAAAGAVNATYRTKE